MDQDPFNNSPFPSKLDNPAAGPGEPTAQAPSQEDINLGIIAHAAGLVTSFTGLGFLPPLVLWLINKGVRPFASNEAIEALNFQITMLIAMMVAGVLMFVLVGFILFPLIWIWCFALSFLGAIKASRGEPYRYPLSIQFLRRD